jgi:hypothetical protein
MWFREDKPYVDKTIKIGSKKIKKYFCLFPKKFRNNGGTHYIWLESIYIVYERVEGGWVNTPWGGTQIEPDYWEQIGVAYSYDNALDEVWIGD